MPIKALPNEANLTELLESLKKEDVIESDTDIVSFLSYFNIKPGDKLTATWFLYDLYKNWSKKRLSKRSFGLELSKYLPRAYEKFVWIDKSALQVSKQLKDYIEVNKKLRPARKSINYHTKFKKFLDRYKITPGNYPIEGFILFHLYDCWAYKTKKEKPLSQKIFISLCDVFFDSFIRKDIMFFYVDRSVMHLMSNQVLKELREGKEFYTHGKKKNNEKIRQLEAYKKAKNEKK
jgi:hypothetical protein